VSARLCRINRDLDAGEPCGCHSEFGRADGKDGEEIDPGSGMLVNVLWRTDASRTSQCQFGGDTPPKTFAKATTLEGQTAGQSQSGPPW
jgi:hypothetical protein